MSGPEARKVTAESGIWRAEKAGQEGRREARGAAAGIGTGSAEMLPAPDWAHLAFLPPEGWGLDPGV